MWTTLHRTLLISSILLVSCGGNSIQITESWDKLEKKLEKGVSLLDRFLVADDPGLLDRMNVFSKDKGDLARDLDEVVEDAVEILDVSELRQHKTQINNLLEESSRVSADLSKLRFDREMASLEKQDEFQKKLDKKAQRLNEIEADIAEQKALLLEAFSAHGVNLEKGEIDTLIYSITGDDDVQLFTVYDNIRTITEKLRAATLQAGESLEISRRYFGMHVLLLRSLLLLQSEYIRRIDEDYSHRLNAIIAENGVLIKEADALIKRSSGGDREQVEANKRAALLTLETAQLYLEYLRSNRDRVTQSVAEVEKKHEIAVHTYRTVAAAYELVSLMNESEQFFQSLGGLQVPELLVFRNSEVRMKFRELTERMGRS